MIVNIWEVASVKAFFFSPASINPTLQRLLQCVFTPSESQQPLRFVKTNTAICFGGGRIERPRGRGLERGCRRIQKGTHANGKHVCLFVCLSPLLDHAADMKAKRQPSDLLVIRRG